MQNIGTVTAENRSETIRISIENIAEPNTIIINPNHHSPLKLLNCHGLDGKSWFKKQGPLWALGRDDKVVTTLSLTFSECTMSHVPPSPRTRKKRGKHPHLYALFKHTYNAQILTKKFRDIV